MVRNKFAKGPVARLASSRWRQEECYNLVQRHVFVRTKFLVPVHSSPPLTWRSCESNPARPPSRLESQQPATHQSRSKMRTHLCLTGSQTQVKPTGQSCNFTAPVS